MSNEPYIHRPTAVVVHSGGHERGREPIHAWHQVVSEPSTTYARWRGVHWFEAVVSIAVVGLVGWFIVDSLITLLVLRGWVRIATVAAAAVVVFLWLRDPAWWRREKLLCIVLFVLAVGTPLAARFA